MDAGARRLPPAACSECRRARRRCGGQSPCHACSVRGIACTYEPVFKIEGSYADRLEANSALRHEKMRLQVAIDRLRLARGLQPTASTSLPPLVALSQVDSSIANAYFATSNRLIRAVDEQTFYAGIRDAAVALPSLEADASAAMLGEDIRAGIPIDRKALAERLGVSACANALLALGCKLQGQSERASRLYALASEGVALAYHHPSRHLVSALLLMAILSRAGHPSDRTALVYASLAARMADFLTDVPECVHVSASVLRYSLSEFGTAPWPATEAPIGIPPRARFADLLSFVIAHLLNDLKGVPHEHETVFEAFLDEILALQTEQGFIPHCPLRTTANGIRTLLAHRRGAHGAALESAVATLSEAFSSPSTHEYYFCEYTISRVISAVGRIAREAQAFHSVDVSPVALSAKIESLRGIARAITFSSRFEFDSRCEIWQSFVHDATTAGTQQPHSSHADSHRTAAEHDAAEVLACMRAASVTIEAGSGSTLPLAAKSVFLDALSSANGRVRTPGSRSPGELAPAPLSGINLLLAATAGGRVVGEATSDSTPVVATVQAGKRLRQQSELVHHQRERPRRSGVPDQPLAPAGRLGAALSC